MTDMISTETTDADPDEARRDALAVRIIDALTAGVELATLELGRRLGLYRALQETGRTTYGIFAAKAGIAERYAREWLEQQAAAGFIDASENQDAGEREYWLPDGHVAVLVEERDPYYLLGAGPMLAGSILPIAEVVDAYRSGEGVAYERYGTEVRHGIATLNRPSFENELGDWINAIPGMTERLQTGGRILDVGCGVGWSTITLAEQFPASRARGIDLDAASIDEARAHAAERGLEGRVHFTTANGTAPIDDPGYDLACIFEALHDMGDPIAVLRSVRSALAPDGVILIGDERVSDEFQAPAGIVERMQFGFSVLHCLPATMAESTAIANGTILRAPTVRHWAEEAGFEMEVLPIEHLFWRFYALRPRSNGDARDAD
ncbi:MAG: class I SAM-dependent methyltransferase [Homoserinimonas sp.]